MTALHPAKVSIIEITLTPESQSEEAQQEVRILLDHFAALQTKETGRVSETITILRDYYALSPELRLTARNKVEGANLGYGIDTHMHVIHKVSYTDIKEGKNLATTRYENIVGYVAYYDDGNAHNPVIFIGDRYVTTEYNDKGFFRGVLRNTMASLQSRMPLYKTDILINSMDDIRLFVSLNFFFLRPHNTQEVSITEARELSDSMIERVRNTESESLCVTTLVDEYPKLFDETYKLFLMARITPYCHTCAKSDVPLSRCTGCHSVVYCSTDCQRKARRTHKKVCTLTRL